MSALKKHETKKVHHCLHKGLQCSLCSTFFRNSPTPKDPKYHCQFCNKKFNSRSGRSSHQASCERQAGTTESNETISLRKKDTVVERLHGCLVVDWNSFDDFERMGQVKEGYDQQGNPKVAFSWFPKNPHSIEVPSIDILLSLKEELKITHKGWQILCEKLHLPTGCGLGAIRKEIEKKNETLGISESPSGKGHVACLKEYLSKVFLSKVKNPDDPVLLKFSFDGAKFSKRIKVVTGTFEVILADTTVSEAKSVVNCHQWLVFLGEEEREELELELEGVAKIVEETLTSKKFIAGEKTFTNVDVVLVCDLKIMLKICGFYSLYCSKTHWRCPWCRVTREQLAKFEIQSWPFRSLEEVKSKEGELRGLTRCTRQQKARINGGYNTYPIFKVSLEHWIPCSLHISMAITKLLLKCTIGNSGEVLGEKFKEVFNKLNIKLVDDKTDLTWKTFKRSRIGAVELLTIASNYSLFVQAWESFANGLPSP